MTSHFNILQLVMLKGTAFIDYLRYSTNPVMIRIWKERVEPYLDEYPLVSNYLDMYLKISEKILVLLE